MSRLLLSCFYTLGFTSVIKINRDLKQEILATLHEVSALLLYRFNGYYSTIWDFTWDCRAFLCACGQVSGKYRT